MTAVPRVLMLPGYTQNAYIFASKMGAIRKGIKDSAELVFVDPPHVVELPTNSSADFDSSATANPTGPEDTPRAWWFAEARENWRHFNRMDETIVYLRDILEKQGPFDAVWGFSQGAASAAILTALVENPSLHPVFATPSKDPSVTWPPPPFKFSILSCGFMPMDPEWNKLFTPALKTPTLHILGRGDTIVAPERALPLVDAFEGARLEWHDGGHHTPSKGSWRQFFKAYLELFREGGPGAEGIKDLPSPSGAVPAPEELSGGKL